MGPNKVDKHPLSLGGDWRLPWHLQDAAVAILVLLLLLQELVQLRIGLWVTSVCIPILASSCGAYRCRVKYPYLRMFCLNLEMGGWQDVQTSGFPTPNPRKWCLHLGVSGGRGAVATASPQLLERVPLKQLLIPQLKLAPMRGRGISHWHSLIMPVHHRVSPIPLGHCSLNLPKLFCCCLIQNKIQYPFSK